MEDPSCPVPVEKGVEMRRVLARVYLRRIDQKTV